MPTQSQTIVTFSGIDGAGKSTQIQALQTHLQEQGFRILLLTFWEDIVVFPHFREFISLKAFKGDAGVGTPDNPIERRDKNVVSWYTVAARLFFYMLDAMSLRWTLWQVPRQIDVVIFDRFIYDELANLPLRHWLLRLYVKLVLAITPRPTMAYLIDADPASAYRRKPEYPLEFLRQNRAAYLSLSRFIPPMQVIGPASIETMTITIFHSLFEHPSGLNTRAHPLPVRHSARREGANSVVS